MKIHHIGYLVKNIDEAKRVFITLGYVDITDTIYDSYRSVYISFLRKNDYTIELVSPASQNSVVYGLFKRTKNSPYHICYESDNIELKIEELKNEGFVQLDKLCCAPAIDNKRVTFLMHKDIGMIELLES